MRAIGRCSGGFLAALIGSMLGGAAVGQPVTVSPATLPRIATVDPRFQSYNVEMVEVTGGWFWKPYERARAATNAPAPPPGFDPERYDYRPPLDLGNPRLRALAAALGPSYVRVSGTWANFTYFHDAAGPAPARPPTGFQAVLTRAQWRGVVGFARAVNAEMVASPAVSLGTRDGQGAWTPAQARALFDYTRIIGGRIAAAEFMNEPNLPTLRGTLPSYDAGMFGRDVAAFGSLLKQVSPHTLYVGPGSAGEALVRGAAAPPLGSERLLSAAGKDAFDVFSYHYYPALSERCGVPAPENVARSRALGEPALAATERIAAFYESLRDDFAPRRPIWITETAEAACGGNRWAATFLDAFRYVDQLGRLARRGVQVVFHNTFSASDYGLVDEASLQPRPNYWAALLWRRLMGTTVLDAGSSPAPGLRLYAHCLAGRRGGVAVLAINADETATRTLALPMSATRYALSARGVADRTVELNAAPLAVGPTGAPPKLRGAATGDRVDLAPLTITFLAFPHVANPACRRPPG